MISRRSDDSIITTDSTPTGSRIRFRHHQIHLADGRRVGISVGGRGVPLVFFHGIGMNRRIYLTLLSRLPQLGFLVIAIDAPGHGDTFAPRFGNDTFDQRVADTEQILIELGIDRAVLVGHSMGGRTAAELAARHPERALAVILVNPALGGVFDAARARIASPAKTAAALAAAVHDTVRDRVGLRGFGHVRFFRTLGGLFVQTAAHPLLFSSAARAIATSNESAASLRSLASGRAGVVIMHGEKDMIVPIESAIDAAILSGATLVTLPDAHHSWVLTTPWTFAEILDRLISERRLGDDLHHALGRRPDSPEFSRQEPCYAPDAAVLGMAPPVYVLGAANPRKRKFYHPWRTWEPGQLVRLAHERP
jgi:pimeloyl-ACP methyl ester carboxylesterase